MKEVTSQLMIKTFLCTAYQTNPAKGVIPFNTAKDVTKP